MQTNYLSRRALILPGKLSGQSLNIQFTRRNLFTSLHCILTRSWFPCSTLFVAESIVYSKITNPTQTNITSKPQRHLPEKGRITAHSDLTTLGHAREYLSCLYSAKFPLTDSRAKCRWNRVSQSSCIPSPVQIVTYRYSFIAERKNYQLMEVWWSLNAQDIKAVPHAE